MRTLFTFVYIYIERRVLNSSPTGRLCKASGRYTVVGIARRFTIATPFANGILVKLKLENKVIIQLLKVKHSNSESQRVAC